MKAFHLALVCFSFPWPSPVCAVNEERSTGYLRGPTPLTFRHLFFTALSPTPEDSFFEVLKRYTVNSLLFLRLRSERYPSSSLFPPPLGSLSIQFPSKSSFY